MRSSFKKIERIKDILDLNGDVLTFKYIDEEIYFNLGEEQLSSIFSRFIKRNLPKIKEGLPNKEIANELFLSEGTIRNYISNILTKLNCKNRTEAVKKSTEEGWL